MKTGRPNKYYTHVMPRFDEIKEWLKAGATDKEIAENLGVNPKVFCKYKNDFNDLNELIKNGRLNTVQEIKAALFKRATGFSYKERKVIKKKIVLKGENEAEIPATLYQTEEYTKYALPDPASAMILLKHWDKETEWTQDPALLKLKKQEFDLKKQHIESGEWI